MLGVPQRFTVDRTSNARSSSPPNAPSAAYFGCLSPFASLFRTARSRSSGKSAGQGLSMVGDLRRDQLLGTGRLPLMTRVTTTLGECGWVIPCCFGPSTNR